MSVASGSVLTDALLQRCRDRAAGYDRDNNFCQEDFDELKAAGYLDMALPTQLGGQGLTLAGVARETRLLALYAPATALCINMHNYWLGVAADLLRGGDHSLEWLLREAAAGEVFAAGHAEHGNDIPGLLSTTKAERVEGGYKLTGRKAFGSLSPVWTRLGRHAMDTSDPEGAEDRARVPAARHRGRIRSRRPGTCSACARRAATTRCSRARSCRTSTSVRVVPAGAAGADMFVVGFFTWALVNFANIYYAIGLRTRDVLIEQLKDKTSIALTRPMIYHPEVQHGIAEITMDLETMGPHVEAMANDWSEGRVGPDWFLRIVALKHRTVEAAFRIVDRALDLSGGFGMFKKSELERLFRDCRAGRFHPANPALSHEIVGKISLGISLDEQPRWG